MTLVLSAKKNLGDIQRCSCGIVHINLGGMTLRLTDADFFYFASMVQEASNKVLGTNIEKLINEKE